MIGLVAAVATEQRLHPGDTTGQHARKRGSLSSAAYPGSGYRKNSLAESAPESESSSTRIHDSIRAIEGETPAEDAPSLPLIRSDVLEKKVFRTEVLWQKRLVTLDVAYLRIANVDDGRTIDTIPLHQISSVKFVPDVESAPARRNSAQTNSKARRASLARRLSAQGVGEIKAEPASTFAFSIVTVGSQNGRAYFLRATTEEMCNSWISDIKVAAKAATALKLKQSEISALERFRIQVEKVFYSKGVQGTIAAIIIVNFIVNIAAAEIVPEKNSLAERGFDLTDYIFTAIFTIELSVNLFINWFYPFFHDGWNIFDFIVVLVAWISYFVSSLPGFGTMRLVRVFRVIRLFKKLESMRVIVTSLTASVLPVLNAFVIMVLITSIYAVFAVSLYGEDEPLLFGRFSASFFTMFQIMTGDEWSTVTRSLFDDGDIVISVAVFFSTYVLVAGIVLINIVVAVLLDEFITTVADEKAIKVMEKRHKDSSHLHQATTTLDPLLASLATLNTAQDVDNRILELFENLDVQAVGSISYQEMAEGMRRLPLNPEIHLSKEDFDVMADSTGVHTIEGGRLDLAAFNNILQTQVKLYIQRNIQHALQDPETQRSPSGSMLLVLKQLNLDVHEIRRAGQQSESELRSEVHQLHAKVDDLVRCIRMLAGDAAPPAMSPAASPSPNSTSNTNTSPAAHRHSDPGPLEPRSLGSLASAGVGADPLWVRRQGAGVLGSNGSGLGRVGMGTGRRSLPEIPLACPDSTPPPPDMLRARDVPSIGQPLPDSDTPPPDPDQPHAEASARTSLAALPRAARAVTEPSLVYSPAPPIHDPSCRLFSASPPALRAHTLPPPSIEAESDLLPISGSLVAGRRLPLLPPAPGSHDPRPPDDAHAAAGLPAGAAEAEGDASSEERAGERSGAGAEGRGGGSGRWGGGSERGGGSEGREGGSEGRGGGSEGRGGGSEGRGGGSEGRGGGSEGRGGVTRSAIAPPRFVAALQDKGGRNAKELPPGGWAGNVC